MPLRARSTAPGGTLVSGRAKSRHGPAYSRFVRIAKILLPALAAMLFGLVVAWPRFGGEEQGFKLGFSDLSQEVDSLSMLNARYFGVDGKNRPYTITADLATQADTAGSIITLDAPKADILLGDGAGVVLDADIGYYRQDGQTLDLVGKVDLFDNRGYEIHTESALINMADNTAEGTEKVRGQGAFGTIESAGFVLGRNGGSILFTGPAKVVLKTTRTKRK